MSSMSQISPTSSASSSSQSPSRLAIPNLLNDDEELRSAAAQQYNYEGSGDQMMQEDVDEDPILRALRRYSASIAHYTANQFETDYMNRNASSAATEMAHV